MQFVTVDKNVKLEVLDFADWYYCFVLLAGMGNTAHVSQVRPKVHGGASRLRDHATRPSGDSKTFYGYERIAPATTSSECSTRSRSLDPCWRGIRLPERS